MQVEFEHVEVVGDPLAEQLEHEKNVLEQLLKLEKEFRRHNEYQLQESEKQCVAVERIWLLTQRYLIICNPPCSPKSDFYPKPTEHVILHEYNDKLRYVRYSNCQLVHSLNKLRAACVKFEQLCSRLDMSMETNFVLGDHFHKPIAYFIELVNDCFKYFNALLLKMKYTAALMDPTDLGNLEDYKKLLKPSEEFQEYLELGLVYCRCLSEKPLCPPKVEPYPCTKKL